jgi:hypothetical protein
VSAGFGKPKKKLVDGQKRKMSEPIIGMSGSPYHLGSMIVLPSDVLVFTARDFLFRPLTIKQLSTARQHRKHPLCQTHKNARAIVDAIAVSNVDRTLSGKITFYFHRQELSVDSLLGGRVPINCIVAVGAACRREFPNLEILPRRLLARRLIDRGGSMSTRSSL